jgi:transposase-like protein
MQLKGECQTAENHQDTRSFSYRRRGEQAVWLALRNITADWGKAAHHWKEAMNQFAILYTARFTREV